MWSLEPIRLRDVKDGTSRTIACIEVPNSGIHWLEPRDMKLAELEAVGLTLTHFAPRSIFKPWQAPQPLPSYALFLDGRVDSVRTPLAGDDARALFTIDGGEAMDDDWWRPR
jgi:hypothetical protein